MARMIVQKNGYYVTLVQHRAELLEMFKLRDLVFVKELQWVDSDLMNLEMDEYDAFADHLCLFNPKHELIGTVRMIRSSERWMVEDCFVMLLPRDYCLKKQRDSVEISRLAVKKEMRKVRVDADNYAVDLLLKGLFIFAYSRSYTKFYMVISNRVSRLLNRRGVPCIPLAEPRKMDDGVVAMTAKLDLNLLFYSTSGPESNWSIKAMRNDMEGISRDNFKKTEKALPEIRC